MVIEKAGRESKVQEVREFKDGVILKVFGEVKVQEVGGFEDGVILKAFGEVKAVVRGSVSSFVEKVKVKRYDEEYEVRETVKKLV